MNKKLEELEIIKLAHAEWNPRTPEELDWDHPEMVKLIASVRSVGIAQPIAVWGDAPNMPDDCALVIAGNRRLEAASAAGLKKIPALVFTGLTEAQAREITRIENEVRLGISPLKDAELIGSMLALKYNQKEIAAHFGVSEATICRRAKLLELVPEIREFAANGKVTADALERMALYPADTQRECFKRFKYNKSESIKWQDVSFDFNRTTRNIDAAKFDKTQCLTCGARSGALGDLWGGFQDSEKLGDCLCSDCYEAKVRSHLMQTVKEIAKGAEIVDALKNNIQYYVCAQDEMFGEKRTKRRSTLWFWMYSSSVSTLWGPTCEEYSRIQKDAAEKEEAEAAQRAERSRLISEAREKADDAANIIVDKVQACVKEYENNCEFYADIFLPGEMDANRRTVLSRWLEKASWFVYDEIPDIYEVLKAFPDFALKCGVTDDEIAAYEEAKKAYEKIWEAK
jgi:ParB/RepB/Spo0J family partition protein